MKFNLRLSNQKLKNIFKGKGERKKVETQARKEVKQRSGDTDVKERSCNLLDERDEIQFEIIKSESKEYI